MKLLSLDTSHELCLALSENDNVVFTGSYKVQRNLAKVLDGKISKSLDKVGWNYNVLDAIAIGTGPGTFTGLRVGMSFIKGLTFAQKTQVVGIPSMDIIAQGVSGSGVVCVIQDARREMIFSALYEKNGSELTIMREPKLSSLQDALNGVPDQAVITGSGVALYEQKIASSISKAQILSEKYWYPKPKNIVTLANAKAKAKRFDDINTLIPLYLYPDDCQVR